MRHLSNVKSNLFAMSCKANYRYSVEYLHSWYVSFEIQVILIPVLLSLSLVSYYILKCLIDIGYIAE